MELQCKNCGKIFEPTCHKSRQVFCSDGCRVKYHNRKRYAPPEEACVECGKALDQGSVGPNRRFCSDECRISYHYRKQQERKRKARQTPRVCPNCGKEFVPMWEKGSPRFCSDECRIEWWREYHKVTPEKKEPNTTCAYCGKSMAGHKGKYCSRACYRLGAAQKRGERRCAWCGKLLPKKARKGQKYCSSSCASAASRQKGTIVSGKRSITTRNNTVWRRQLAELARKTDIEEKKDRPIYLVCGVMKRMSTDILIEYIRYELKCEPYDGSLYVFCGSGRTRIKWLWWDGSGICEGSRYAQRGTYPWPVKKGEVMEITEKEYVFLRSMSIGKNE